MCARSRSASGSPPARAASLPHENGICHFIEHMLFKGTTSRSAEEIARSVDSIGGNLDAFTSKELVSFNAKVLDEHLPLAFDVLSDLVLHPLFRAEDVEKEKGVILEELKMDADNPEYLVHEIFSANFWKGHAHRQAHPGHQGNHPELQPRDAWRNTTTALRLRELHDHRRRQPEAREHRRTGAGALRRLAVHGRAARPDATPAHARADRHSQQEVARAGAPVPGRALLPAVARRPLCLLRPEHAARRRA